MAKIRNSIVLTKLSGKLGGSTFQGGTNGISFKGKVQRLKHYTDAKRTCKNNMAIVCYNWKHLNLFQKQNWADYSTFTNSLYRNNQNVILPGFFAYQKVNLQRLSQGLSVLEDAPAGAVIPAYADLTIWFAPVDGLSIYSNRDILATEFLLLKVSPPKQTGAEIRANDCQKILITNYPALEWIIETEYINLYGRVPAAGESVGMCWGVCSTVSGVRLPLQFKITDF
jgi:hypothetical protein